MKERYFPGGREITPEQTRQARQTNLTHFLIAQGEHLIQRGRRYIDPNHDSLVFTENAYYWNSRQESGNAIDFLVRHRGHDFKSAVTALIGEATTFSPPLPTESTGFNPALLELSTDRKQVTDYLHQERGISLSLLVEILSGNLLLQERHTNNILFPIYNTDGKIVGAEVAGTMAAKRFKGVKTGSLYGHGYTLRYGQKPRRFYFFESAIDLLSFVDWQRRTGEQLHDSQLTSMAGLKASVITTALTASAWPPEPFLGVDNDLAGQTFIDRLTRIYPALTACLPDPAFKDWNEQLLSLRAGS